MFQEGCQTRQSKWSLLTLKSMNMWIKKHDTVRKIKGREWENAQHTKNVFPEIK